MANAKEIKERMASIEETRKITNAMYLISSSKMKQAKKKLADTEPFFYAMQAEIARILRHVPDMHSQFFDGRESIPDEERKIGYIVVTADKGLAGAYNHNVIKATEELLKKPGKHKLFVLGEAGRQYFAKREGIEMDTQFRYTVQNPTLHRSRVISSEMVEQFRNGDLDEIIDSLTAADQAAKTAIVDVIELRIAKGMCGKSYMLLTGEVSAVEASIEKAKNLVASKGMYLDSSVIAHPDQRMIDSIL